MKREAAPTFAVQYPDDPRLRDLLERFERGNYRAVRDGVASLLAGDASDEVKAAARDLRSRTEPSRLQLALIGIAAVFVIALSAYEVVIHHVSR